SRTQILAQSTGLIIESVASQRTRWSRSLVANGNGDDQSFTWDGTDPRLSVRVSLTGVNLAPEYDDTFVTMATTSGAKQDASDNKFIAKYLAMVDQIAGSNRTNLLNAVLSKYCRQPVPDHYVVRLERQDGGLTNVGKVTCRSRADEARNKADAIECPSGYLPGDRYYYRRLNESCSHGNSVGEPAGKRKSYAFQCGQKTALLRRPVQHDYGRKMSCCRWPRGLDKMTAAMQKSKCVTAEPDLRQG
uniref:Liporotein n=1 Tax=Macrostomum lignano TaxID=282301 RepID=A0A1I8F8P9_9PLAT